MAELMVTEKNTRLPLKSVEFEAEVKGYVSGLQAVLRYSNDSDDPAEVVFRFPVEQSYAVVGLTAVVDGRRVKAELREKEEARAIYDDAIASGKTAALGEEKSGDVFSLSLGNLPPKKEAEVHLRLAGELPHDAEGGARFSLPTSLKPRYTPAGSTDPLAPLNNDAPLVRRATGPGVNRFSMTVHDEAEIEAVTSPTHSVTSSREGGVVTVTLEENLEKDLVILVKHRDPHRPTVTVEGGAEPTSTERGLISGPAVMLTFYPEFKTTEAAGEFLFLVDRSGSMSGSYINSAKETLILFLKSLREGCYFNIIGFGTSYQKLFPSSVPYEESTLSQAVSHAQALQADLGGTELLPPLEHIFSQKPLPGLPRQLFVLTDGSVSNTMKCIECVKTNSQTARCFTFGIGSGASTDLVEGLAKAGGGTSEFVKEGERMQAKVIRSLKRALQPAVTDVVVDYKVPDEYEVLQSPQTIPAIFNGEKLVMYGILKPKTTPIPRGTGVVVLKGTMLGASIEHSISFEIKPTTRLPFLTIHHLAAKGLIKDWEVENRKKEEIVRLSKEMGVVSSHTAFVAVDEGNREPVRGAMKTWDVLQPAVEMEGGYSSHALSMAATPSGKASDLCMQVDSVHQLMRANIDKIALRGEKLEDLHECSVTLGNSAESFSRSSRAVKKSGGLFSGLFTKLFGSSSPRVDHYSSTEESSSISHMDTTYALAVDDDFDFEAPSTSHVPVSYEASMVAPSKIPQSSRDPPLKAAQSREASLSAILIFQQADGSWNLDDSLAHQLGKGRQELEEACPVKCHNGMSRVWGTLLVLCLMKTKHSEKQEEWELVATKAEGWLSKQALPSGVTLEQLRAAAMKCI